VLVAEFSTSTGGTNLEIVAAPPPGLEALADVYEDGYDITTAIGELLHLDLLPDQPVDIELLAPWDACGDNQACLQKELPTPYLPELQNG
jgi:hypothetical protein